MLLAAAVAVTASIRLLLYMHLQFDPYADPYIIVRLCSEGLKAKAVQRLNQLEFSHVC